MGFNHPRSRGTLKEIHERNGYVGHEENFNEYYAYENHLKDLYDLASETNDSNLMKSLGFLEKPEGLIMSNIKFKLNQKIASLNLDQSQINYFKFKLSEVIEPLYKHLISPVKEMGSLGSDVLFRRIK
jgi:hypothetical protein